MATSKPLPPPGPTLFFLPNTPCSPHHASIQLHLVNKTRTKLCDFITLYSLQHLHINMEYACGWNSVVQSKRNGMGDDVLLYELKSHTWNQHSIFWYTPELANIIYKRGKLHQQVRVFLLYRETGILKMKNWYFFCVEITAWLCIQRGCLRSTIRKISKLRVWDNLNIFYQFYPQQESL